MNTYKMIDLFINSYDEFFHELAKQEHKQFLNPEDAGPYIPFTKDEVIAHIVKNIPKNKLAQENTFRNIFSRTPDSQDGTYLIATGEGFKLYDQERGQASPAEEFATEEEAIAKLKARYSEPPKTIEDITEFVTKRFHMFGIIV